MQKEKSRAAKQTIGRSRRRIRRIKEFVATVYHELLRTRTDVATAALSFYFLLSLVALLAILSALLNYMPMTHPFRQLLEIMGALVPAEEMATVHNLVINIPASHTGGILSFGLLGYLWTASNGFSATIEALDIAYDVERGRSWWRDRLQAIVLTSTTGVFIFASLLAIAAGPHFGRLLSDLFPIPRQFAILWPSLRLVFTCATFILAVELLYYLAPNCKQRFRSTFPGAVVAVLGWFIGSFSLNLYLLHLVDYNKTYGVLGAVMVIMLWFYIVAFAILTGAEVNAELGKAMIRWRLEDSLLVRPIRGVPAA